MKKILSFSAFMIVGLVLSQLLPLWAGSEYGIVKNTSNVLLYVCLSFIMINVGREFEVDKVRWKSYAQDYFIAMSTAAMPWFFIALYYVFVLLPPEFWHSWDAWTENLLLSRFAAPTSAGILFTMLAAIGLKTSWIYKKIQVLAIFDDLDTILLMIPLQIMMIGMRWQVIIVVFIVFLLLSIGWRQLGKFNLRQDWKAILFYSVLVFIATQALYVISKNLYGDDGSIHIEVLLPAFVLGMVMKHKEIDTPIERKVSTGISFLFMFLVGISMPHFIGVDFAESHAGAHSVTGSQAMMPWSVIAFHVLVVSLLSNIGKLFPVFFYRDRKFSERLALSIGMFTRGEVGAGIIFIALGYNLGGPALIISVLTIVLNLILTGVFVLWVKKLALRSYSV
ncbi:MAG: sodium:proton antiporter [Bacteroides sp.]|uniref:sodium:proton antiporter n=1 Tax=Bacteroides sp. TaxID=29523 RepID=UPI001B60FED3|nr:sodium:proton antiporter [Bacteroides sp.]MBP6065959.1 sodium:proton antiporter [Bacteroides sp.]MBP6068289.1 sodium:proton antiporter [Bacteroides sp.]MBP8623137.1 sodium:proton antiporter [Bacteroides sp.]MBP9586901.1 sodium:proton antiporter [Bacteroides sp.]